MNEDIKILESECHYLEELGYLRENNHFIRFNQALENLIKGYRELEEENKRLKPKIDVCNWQEKSCREIIDEKYIPVSLVEEKIEELNKLITEAQKELGSASKEYTIYVYQEDILQELLEKRK